MFHGFSLSLESYRARAKARRTAARSSRISGAAWRSRRVQGWLSGSRKGVAARPGHDGNQGICRSAATSASGLALARLTIRRGAASKHAAAVNSPIFLPPTRLRKSAAPARVLASASSLVSIFHTKRRGEHSLNPGARISYGSNPPYEAALLRFRDAISCIVPS